MYIPPPRNAHIKCVFTCDTLPRPSLLRYISSRCNRGTLYTQQSSSVCIYLYMYNIYAIDLRALLHLTWPRLLHSRFRTNYKGSPTYIHVHKRIHTSQTHIAIHNELPDSRTA